MFSRPQRKVFLYEIAFPSSFSPLYTCVMRGVIQCVCKKHFFTLFIDFFAVPVVYSWFSPLSYSKMARSLLQVCHLSLCPTPYSPLPHVHAQPAIDELVHASHGDSGCQLSSSTWHTPGPQAFLVAIVPHL